MLRTVPIDCASFSNSRVILALSWRTLCAGAGSSGQELAASLIRLFGVLLDTPDGLASDITKVLECLFVKSLVWSVGACIDRAGRKAFGNYIRMVIEGKGLEDSDCHQDFLLKNRTWTARDRPMSFLPPNDGRLPYDFRFDAKKGQWQTWIDAVRSRFHKYAAQEHFAVYLPHRPIKLST